MPDFLVSVPVGYSQVTPLLLRCLKRKESGRAEQSEMMGK